MRGGGNGGFAEVSGYNSLIFDGMVNLSAPRGLGGTLLLDPNNINITTAGSPITDLSAAGGNAPPLAEYLFSENPAADVDISPVAVSVLTSLGTNVVLQAHTDITVTSAITSVGGAGNLTLQAGDDIYLNNTITLAGGALSLVAGDPGGTPSGPNADAGRNITVGSAISTGAGVITMSATDSIAINASVTNTSSVSLTSTAGAISQSVATGSISTGSLTTNSVGGTVLNGANTVSSFSATNTPNGTVELTNTAATLTVNGISQGDGGLTISNTGHLTVAGAVTAATTGAISLAAAGAGNNVQLNSNVTSGSGTVAVTAANNVVIGNGVTVSTTGGVNLTATAGQILENGATAGKVVASALTTLSALGQTLNGANQVNVFNATNTGASGSITLSNSATPLSVTGSNTSGDFIVLQTGALSTGGTISAVNVNLTGTTGIGIGHAVTATGNLDLTSSNAAIGQSSGLATITVTGVTTVDAGSSGSIGLDVPSNNFQGAVNLTGGTTSIRDTNDLTLGTLSTGNLTAVSGGALNLGQGTVTGTLQATSGGDISQSGALTVTATATIDAVTNNITLDNTSNNFNSVVLTGNDVSLSDTDNLTATATADGSLTLNAGGVLSTGGTLSGVNVALTGTGGITLGHAVTATGTLGLASTNQTIGQTVGGVITATGVTTINAGASGDISLMLPTNDFQSTVHLTGLNAHVVDKDALTLGTLDLNNNLTVSANAGGFTGTLNLGTGSIDGILSATSAGGAITQSGALTVGFGATINAGTGNITLLQANDFGLGTVSLTGANASLADTNALTATATATGNLNLVAGGLLSTATGGLAGADVTLAGATGITLGHDVIASGTLSLTSNNATIGQTGGGRVSAVGPTTVNAGTGDISLDVPSNNFQSAVALSGGAISVRDTDDLTVSVLARSGADKMLILHAGGQLTLPAQNIDTGTAILQLRSQGGTLATPGNLSGGSVTLVGRDGLSLDHNVTASSLLLGATDSAIQQTAGAISVTGTTFVGAGTGAITLTRLTNNFQGAVDLTGGTTQITDANALTLGTLATGSLTAIANAGGGAANLNLGQGTVSGALSATSNGGNVIQSASGLTVTGDATINAGAGDITLANAANNFQGLVNLTGAVTQITDVGALALGTLSTGNLTVISTGDLNLGQGSVTGTLSATSNGGDIIQSGALTATNTATIGAGAGDITLNAANEFSSVVLTGANISLTDSTALTATATATGALTLSAAGLLSSGGALSGTVVSLTGSSVTNSHTITGTGGVTISANTATTGTFTNSATGAVSNGGGSSSVSVVADNVDLQSGSSIVGGSGTVQISQKTATRSIDIGSEDSNKLSLTDGELATITTTGLVAIGGSGSGNLDITAPIAIVGETYQFSAGTGALSVAALLTSNRSIRLQADTVAIGAAVDVGGNTVHVNPTAGRAIELGSENAAAMSLTDAEIDLITAGSIRIGETTSGNITVTQALAPAGSTTLGLITGGTITSTGSGSIQVSNLALTAAGDIDLTVNANTVDKLSASISGAGSSLAFKNTDDLAVDTADLLSGITTSNGNVSLHSTGGEIAVTQNINAGTAAVTLQANDFTLTGNIIAGSINLVLNTGVPIFLGGSGAGFDLTDAEIDAIGVNAGGNVHIGAADAGDITIVGPITGANEAGSGTAYTLLSLTTGGKIIDGNATGVDVTVLDLAMRAVTGIGAVGNPHRDSGEQPVD